MKNSISILAFLLFVIACVSERNLEVLPEKKVENPPIPEIEIAEEKSEEKIFKISAWVRVDKPFEDSIWQAKLLKYDSLGIMEILVQGDTTFLKQLLPLATKIGIKVHAWISTINQPNNKETQQHPDWYAVNRKGKNSLEYRPYVNSYQWLSPFHPEACEYIKNKVRSFATIKGLESVHLDYVRYVDVVLGADLQTKYNIKQTAQYPQYDYDYHPLARKGFKEIFGVDPMLMEHPELSPEWQQYRLNALTDLVNQLADIAHENGTKLTAAVFPYPELAKQMVRQAWDDWNLDAAYPMLYHNFYKQNIKWIGFATKQAVNAVDFPVYSGLYMPALKDSTEFKEAILMTKINGASGICIFTGEELFNNFE